MALLKPIELDSGISINYHRIAVVTKITNHSIILEIAGYTSKEKRDEEIRKMETNEEMNIYINTSFVCVDYDETSTITDWYEYLKTTDMYNGAEDV